MFLALNSRKNQVLLFCSANVTQFQPLKSNKMSDTNISPQTSSGNTGRVTFQSTPNSEVNTTQSSNDGPSTPNPKNFYPIIQVFSGFDQRRSSFEGSERLHSPKRQTKVQRCKTLHALVPA